MPGSETSLRSTAFLLDWTSSVIVGGAVIAATCAGCSCRREAPRSSWDKGLPIAATDAAPDAETGSAMVEGNPGDGTGRSVEAVTAGGGADGTTGNGRGDTGASGADDASPPGDGSDDRGSEGSGAAQDSQGGGDSPGPSESGPSRGRGAGDGKGTGIGDDRKPRAGVFPGRESKPELDAARAIADAEAALVAAERERARGRFPEAYDQARAAYEAVRPHVETDGRCKEVADRALALVRDLEKRIDKRPSPVRAAPTVFE